MAEIAVMADYVAAVETIIVSRGYELVAMSAHKVGTIFEGAVLVYHPSNGEWVSWYIDAYGATHTGVYGNRDDATEAYTRRTRDAASRGGE